MKLSRQNIYELYVGLNSVGNLEGVKFAYAISRNLSKLQNEIDALQKANTPKPEFLEYDKKRATMAQDMAVKENGAAKTKMENGIESFVITDMATFEKKLSDLQKKYKAAITEREKQMQEFGELLKEEIDVDLYMIPIEYVPEKITAKQLNSIMPIIKSQS